MTMRFCDPHERRMRAVCCDLGLQFRISRNAEHLEQRKARNDRFDVDPLELMRNGLMALATVVIRHNDINPHFVGCPLCFFHEESLAADWVGNVARAAQKKVEQLDAEKRADQERNAELEAEARSL